MQTISQNNKALCRRFFEELYNNNNPQVIDALVDAKVVVHNPFPTMSPDLQGLKNTAALFRQAFPDLCVTIDELIAENDTVAARLTLTGTHKGEFMNMGPNNHGIAYKEIVFLRLHQLKITEYRALTDTMGLVQQLGIAPIENTAPAQGSETI